LKYIFYLIFALEIGVAFTIADIFADKIKHKYKHKKIHNLLGTISTIILFAASATISYEAWLNMNVGLIILGFILLCISFIALTFVQKDYTSHRR
jgi:divalent metal cation (Fe/Co/Zn/Cd) transporter